MKAVFRFVTKLVLVMAIWTGVELHCPAQSFSGGSFDLGGGGELTFTPPDPTPITTTEITSGETLGAGYNDAPANVNVYANLVFDNGSVFQNTIDSGKSLTSTLSVLGNLTLNDPELVLSDVASSPSVIPYGESAVIVHYGGTEAGNFLVNGVVIHNGDTFNSGLNSFQINYDNGGSNNITVMSVPEPTSWILAVLAGGCFLILRRRSQIDAGAS